MFPDDWEESLPNTPREWVARTSATYNISWIIPIHGSLHIPVRSCYSWIGWKIHGWGGPDIWKEGTRATERDETNAWGFLRSMDGVSIHGTCPPIHGPGGGLHESRATDSKPKSAFYGRLSFVNQMKIHIVFILHFSYSLSFLFFLPSPIHGSGLPHPWIFHFEISHNINKYISVFVSSSSIVPCPLFPCFWPTPLVDFSPYPWMFLHETSNRIDEYVQRSMDGGTPRVACNNFYLVCQVQQVLLFLFRRYTSSSKKKCQDRSYICSKRYT